MSAMVDPMKALVQLQEALDSHRVLPVRCELHPDLQVIFDQPLGGLRITYAHIESEKVISVSVFALADPIDGVPCFNIGYAVIEDMRQRGLATDVVSKGIEELTNGFRRNGTEKFYIEAVVSDSNTPSNRLARKLLSNSPVPCTDVHSGEPALQYVRLMS